MRLALATLLLALAACATPTEPAPWSPTYDSDWYAACDCWGREPSKPEVLVMDCETDADGVQHFGYAGKQYCGLSRGSVVMVCPDLAALRHEFSHYVASRAGIANWNGMGKCWL